MARRNWTRDELIVAFNLYCKIPFGQIHKGNPEIIQLAKLIDRTPSAVGFKLSNFARLDPSLQARGIKGLEHGGKGDILVWEEFNENWEELSLESEIILEKYRGIDSNKISDIVIPEYLKDTEQQSLVKTRKTQQFFRATILSAYQGTCCITGLNVPELLIASHIVPWSQDKKNRVNPMNGLCLNALHDKAFDKGLITLDEDYRIQISKNIYQHNDVPFVEKNFIKFENQVIQLPKKFIPNQEFIKYHRENIYQGG